MKDYKNNDYWENIPDELRLLCLASTQGDGDRYCTSPILSWIIDHLDDPELSVKDKLQVIDASLEHALLPLEFHETDWIEYRDKITKILQHFERLISENITSEKENFV